MVIIQVIDMVRVSCEGNIITTLPEDINRGNKVLILLHQCHSIQITGNTSVLNLRNNQQDHEQHLKQKF